jgi:hypothetical protein
LEWTVLRSFSRVTEQKLQKQYNDFLSGFTTWKQTSHAKQWLNYPSPIVNRLSIDESPFFNENFYTVLTNNKNKKIFIVVLYYYNNRLKAKLYTTNKIVI